MTDKSSEPTGEDPPRTRLLARRVRRADVVSGRAYVIHARNGGVGVAWVDPEGRLGYALRREKMGDIFVFTELDWDTGPPFGTAIPLRLLDGMPPEDEAERLDWLAEREEECREETQAAWDVVLGPSAVTWRRWREERTRAREERRRGR